MFRMSLFFLCFLGGIFGEERLSSTPYISGDTFRAFADYLYDETCKEPHPEKMKPGSTIFVKNDFLSEFFSKIHPRIRVPYILISHNGADTIPGNLHRYLNDPKLIAWFGHDVENIKHPKLIPMPNGLANQRWPHGSIPILESCLSKKQYTEKEHLLYLNLKLGTYPQERQYVYNLFKDKDYCYNVDCRPFEEYLHDLAKTKFVLSPRGYGVDCHRTWEAIYMGAVPIVKSSSLDPLFDDLPVLIVKDWTEITEEFLNKKWEELSTKKYKFEKMYIEYWFEKINKYKTHYQGGSKK